MYSKFRLIILWIEIFVLFIRFGLGVKYREFFRCFDCMWIHVLKANYEE